LNPRKGFTKDAVEVAVGWRMGAGNEAEAANFNFAATSLLRRLLFRPALMTRSAKC
jgi:hypothetical protein